MLNYLSCSCINLYGKKIWPRLKDVDMTVPNPNEPMIANPKDGCEIKGMMKGFKYGMVMNTLLQSKFLK